MERISWNDCKLIIIYGCFGVGKSFLVNVGLILVLKNISILVWDIVLVVV